MKDTEKITLKNMVFSGFVGASEREREQQTRIEVDIEIHTDLGRACKSDDLDDTIDYSRLHALAGEVIAAKHHNLLESLAEEICDAAFVVSDCEKIVVRVRKPRPPIEGHCDAAEIEIVRHNINRR
jgi:dihydroneopterin aldolase